MRLILLRSLLLDFPCATAAAPITQDRLFLNVRSVGRMAHPPYSALVPSPAGFMRLVLLRSLLLDFPCATLATPIAQDRLFLNFRWLVEESRICLYSLCALPRRLSLARRQLKLPANLASRVT